MPARAIVTDRAAGSRTAHTQVANAGSFSEPAIRFSLSSSISGSRPASASACAPARSCTITVAASGPWPIASPTMRTVRPSGSGMMSYQSPPMM